MDPLPKSGENYKCPRCGFAVSVTADCGCDNMHAVVLKCCNAALEKVEKGEKAKAEAPPKGHHEEGVPAHPAHGHKK